MIFLLQHLATPIEMGESDNNRVTTRPSKTKRWRETEWEWQYQPSKVEQEGQQPCETEKSRSSRLSEKSRWSRLERARRVSKGYSTPFEKLTIQHFFSIFWSFIGRTIIYPKLFLKIIYRKFTSTWCDTRNSRDRCWTISGSISYFSVIWPARHWRVTFRPKYHNRL